MTKFTVDDYTPPIKVTLERDDDDVDILLNGDSVAFFGGDGLYLFQCKGKDVQKKYPELFDSDGYIKIEK